MAPQHFSRYSQGFYVNTYHGLEWIPMVRTDSTSHIRTVVSSEAVARLWLSEDQATSDKPSVWPARFLMNSPVSGDQILATVSAPMEEEGLIQ